MNRCPQCASEFADSVRICPKDGTVLEAVAPTDPRVGTLLDGKYKLEAPLGVGGMGTIYRATHLMLDKPVAVKLIKDDYGKSPEVVRRFQREARAASNLNHPNIAAAYDLGQTSDGTLYIAMELVRGPSLKDLIRASGPLEVQRLGRLLRQVASALAVAHRNGIIHRDLKPQNIMLATEPDGTEVAKLLDFGIAKTFDEQATQLTATGFVIGTPLYMSPEQAAGRAIDARSDLYSLGIIMFEMLVGEVPFSDPSTPALLVKHLTEPAPVPSRRRPDLHIAPEIEAIALRCMEKDPAARYQSAEEFAAALNLALGTTGTAPHAAAAVASAATVIVPPPGSYSPTIAATAAPTVPPVVPRAAPSQQKTGLVSPPASVSAAALAAAAGGSMPPPATVAAYAPATAPPPASVAQAQASTPTRSNPTGRNALIIAAVVLAVVGAAAYAAGTWYRGRVRPVAVASVAPAEQPPATSVPALPADTTPAATPPSVPTATPPGAPPPDPLATAPPSAPPNAAPPNSAVSTTPAPSQLSPGRSVTPPPNPAGTVPGPARGATGPGAGTALAGVAGNRESRGKTPAATAPAATAAAPTQAANPAVVFRCSGRATNVCSALRSAMGPALEAQSIIAVQDTARADILVEARVEIASERVEQMFGTTFVTRTYSVELAGESRRTSQVVPMPAATSFSFDDRVGQDKLAGQAQLIATATAEKIRAFWNR